MEPGLEKLVENLQKGDKELKKEAARLIGDSGDLEGLKKVINFLDEKDLDLLDIYIRVLLNNKEKVIDFLIDTLGDEKWIKRKNAARVLSYMGAAPIPKLMDIFKNSDDNSQFWVINILGDIGEDAIDFLLEQLKTKDKELLFLIIQALGRTKSKRAIEPLVDLLFSEEWFVRKNAAEALWEIGAPSVNPLLEALKKTDSENVIYWIITILGEIRDERAVESLVKIFKAGTKMEKNNAAIALGNIESCKAIKPLIKALGDEHWIVRKNSADALYAIGEEAVSELINSLEDKDINIRYWATRVLGEFKAETAMDFLIKRLKDSQWTVRGAAAYALGEIGNISAAEYLIDALKDENEEVRKNAVIALGCLGDDVIEPLKIKLKDKDDWIRHYALEALNKVQMKGYLDVPDIQEVEEFVNSCPACNKAVLDNFMYCPYCKEILHKKCDSCDKILELDWKICPVCGENVSDS